MQLGKQCDRCHNERTWRDAPFDHNQSRFPLRGRHDGLECRKCHLTPAFKDAKPECASCHAKDDHHKERLGPRCEQCHNVRGWKTWDFDHNSAQPFQARRGARQGQVLCLPHGARAGTSSCWRRIARVAMPKRTTSISVATARSASAVTSRTTGARSSSRTVPARQPPRPPQAARNDRVSALVGLRPAAHPDALALRAPPAAPRSARTGHHATVSWKPDLPIRPAFTRSSTRTSAWALARACGRVPRAPSGS